MKFEELGLHEDILEGIRPMNFDRMTPVQEQTIPVIMEGRDLIGCAQTGTGKTAAYTLPRSSGCCGRAIPTTWSSR